MPYVSTDVKRKSVCDLNVMENTKCLKNRGSHVQVSLLKQLCTCGLDVGGRYQFRALSDQLYRSPDHHKFVRSKVVFQVNWFHSIFTVSTSLALLDLHLNRCLTIISELSRSRQLKYYLGACVRNIGKGSNYRVPTAVIFIGLKSILCQHSHCKLSNSLLICQGDNWCS